MIQLVLRVFVLIPCIGSSIQIESVHKWVHPTEKCEAKQCLLDSGCYPCPKLNILCDTVLVQLTPDKINRPWAQPVLINLESQALRSFVLPDTACQGRVRPRVPPTSYSCPAEPLEFLQGLWVSVTRFFIKHAMILSMVHSLTSCMIWASVSLSLRGHLSFEGLLWGLKKINV